MEDKKQWKNELHRAYKLQPLSSPLLAMHQVAIHKAAMLASDV